MAPTATSPSLQGANPLSNLKHKAETKLHDVVNGNSNSNSNSNARSSRPTTALPLIDLYSGTVNADSTASSKRLCADIIQGLKGRSALTVPGDVNNPQDLKFAFKRTLPTMILYDEQGLLFYDKIAEVPEYYLFNAELDILKTYGTEIALRIFGHTTPQSAHFAGSYKDAMRTPKPNFDDEGHGPDGAPETVHEDGVPNGGGGGLEHSVKRKEKWGDQQVGRFNGGVNAEEGMDGDRAVGCASLVELGAGSLRKTVHLIRALAELPKGSEAERTDPNVQYYALDLDKAELVRTLEELRTQEAGKQETGDWTVLDGQVGLNGMWATYDQGLDFIGKGGLKADKAEGKRCLLWLGSSIGNFDRRGAAEFLRTAASTALRAGDTMLVSVDRRNKPEEVALAYHDPAGVTTDFIMNGLDHADRVLGGNVLDKSKFEYYDRYNDTEGRHESYYRSLCDQTITVPGEDPIQMSTGELIHVESSYKYSEREALDLFDAAGLRVVQRWEDSSSRYDVWLVERPNFHFSSSRLLTGTRAELESGISIQNANKAKGVNGMDSDGGMGSHGISQDTELVSNWGLPSLDEWDNMWKAWDTVTLTMIPRNMLFEKPIDLRHLCLFYIGHIPAFLDIHISRLLKEPHTNDRFSAIFERGIDPHMDDLTQCNPHSEVPTKVEDWPTLEEILAYKEKVIERVRKIYADIANGQRTLDRRLARMLWMTLEHKGLHMETLLYMLAQSQNTLPPAGFTAPDWYTLARSWEAADERAGGAAARSAVIKFEAGSIILGHDDDDGADFDIKATRATDDIADLNEQLGNPEFGWDNEHPPRKVDVGAYSISANPITNGEYVEYLSATGKTDYPSSWVDLSAGSTNGDGHTNGLHVRTVYGPVDMRVAKLWPVQASGAQLADYAAWKGGRLPTHAELRQFLDATHGPNCTDRPGTNIGFRNWHPVPAQLPRKDVDGRWLPGHNGGVWEWTSTPFMPHEGFRDSALYPGYSSDFHDTKHNVVLGGSWATVPCIAGRRTFVNSYQRQYPYIFGGARVVFDATTPTKG